MTKIDMKVSDNGVVEYNYYGSAHAVYHVVLKAILTMLFSLLFMATVSADTGTIEGRVTHTSMTNGTVTVYSKRGDNEVINHVPLTVIGDASLCCMYIYIYKTSI